MTDKLSRDEYFIDTLSSFTSSLADLYPNDNGIQSGNNKMKMYKMAGLDKNVKYNNDVIDTWLETTKEIVPALRSKDVDIIQGVTASYKARGIDNILTQMDPGSILADATVHSNTKNLLWQYVNRLQDIAEDPNYSVSNSQQKKHARKQEVEQKVKSGNQDAGSKMADNIRTFAPQMAELLKGVLSGESEVGKAIKEVLDPEKPEGKAAWGAIEMVKDKMGEGGPESFMGQMSGGGDDDSVLIPKMQKMEDSHEDLLERVAYLEGQVQSLFALLRTGRKKKEGSSSQHKKHQHRVKKVTTKRYISDDDESTDSGVEDID